MRQLTIYQKALDFFPEVSEKFQPSETDNPDLAEQTEVWIDTFNEYARKHNEEWREDLLAKSLAIEANQPGTLNQQALWFIGTIDKEIFESFSAILNNSINIRINYILPESSTFKSREVPGYNRHFNNTLGNHMAFIKDSGLIGDQQITAGITTLMANYGEHQFYAHSDKELKFSVLLSPLGNIIAKLYEPKINDLGIEMFLFWKSKIRVRFNHIFKET